jgi:hypothetical protein
MMLPTPDAAAGSRRRAAAEVERHQWRWRSQGRRSVRPRRNGLETWHSGGQYRRWRLEVTLSAKKGLASSRENENPGVTPWETARVDPL